MTHRFLDSSARRALLAGAFAFCLALIPAAAPAQGDGKDSSEVLPNTFATLAERTLPSVVAVYVKVSVKEQMSDLRQKMGAF